MLRRLFPSVATILIVAVAALIAGGVLYLNKHDIRLWSQSTQTQGYSDQVSSTSQPANTPTPNAATTSALVYDIAGSDWKNSQPAVSVRFRLPITWQGYQDYWSASSSNFYELIESPDINNFPGFPDYEVHYVLTITDLGLDHYKAFGRFEAIPPYDPNEWEIPVANSVVENSPEYAVAKTIVSTFSANQPIRFEEVPPDENGRSTLMGHAIAFQYPVLYPSSWASDCQLGGAQAVGSPATLYCELMSQPYDFYNPSTTVPADFCALRLTAGEYATTSIYDTYTDSSGKENCQQDLDTIEGEFSKNLNSILR